MNIYICACMNSHNLLCFSLQDLILTSWMMLARLYSTGLQLLAHMKWSVFSSSNDILVHYHSCANRWSTYWNMVQMSTEASSHPLCIMLLVLVVLTLLNSYCSMELILTSGMRTATHPWRRLKREEMSGTDRSSKFLRTQVSV